METSWALSEGRTRARLNCKPGPADVTGEPLDFLPLNVPLCPQHLLKCSFDVVKRWVNEAQEAASSDNIMVQVRCERSSGFKLFRPMAWHWPVRMDSHHRHPGGP